MTDPTPPAAPRPCECGHDVTRHRAAARSPVLCDAADCFCTSYRPVSPEAAPPLDIYGDVELLPFSAPAEAAPPRATTAPMTEERLATLRARNRSRGALSIWEIDELLAEVDRLRASSPSRESGALLDSYVAEMTRLTRDLSQVETVRAARAALDRRLSTLERDAARMRGIADALIESLGMADSLIEALTDRGTHHNTGDERMSETTWRRTYGTVRATKMVGCPVCGAAPAVACESVDGTMHLARFDAYNELRAPTTETPDNG